VRLRKVARSSSGRTIRNRFHWSEYAEIVRDWSAVGVEVWVMF
jgi:hypothetical protein